MKTSGKLKYLNDILKYYDEYNSILENKNVPMINTSNVPVYQEEFYTMFPIISVRSKWNNLKRTNENCLDLNMILKFFAIINGYTFDNNELEKFISRKLALELAEIWNNKYLIVGKLFNKLFTK